MKTLLLVTFVSALSALAGCQSSSVASSQRTIELGGTQARYSVEIPQDQTVASNPQPYTLQGSSGATPANTMPPTSGFQAR